MSFISFINSESIPLSSTRVPESRSEKNYANMSNRFGECLSGRVKKMSNTTLSNAEKVIDWIKQNQGYWNDELLEIRESKLGGIGVFAKQDIEPTLTPELLLRLPKESLLSAKKSSIGNLIYEEQIEGALALILAFIYEKHFGKSSPWWEYITTIEFKDPKTDQLILPPALWTSKEKSLLKGSEIELMGALDDEENKAAYETACTFALNQHEIHENIPIPWELDIEGKDDKEIFEKYKTFIAISHAIASRDFEIDAFHQVALVPGADLFNHTNKPTVRFESVFDVCEKCGSSDHCDCLESENEEESGAESEDESDGEENGHEDHDEDMSDQEGEDQQEEDSEEEDEDGPIDEAFIEKIEKALQAEKEEEAKHNEDSDDEEQITIKNESGAKILPDDCCDIVLMKKVSKGDELFNTYGDFNNSILLSKYGFVIPENSDESVGLGVQFLKIKKANKKLYAKQFDWWEAQGYEMVRELFHVKKNDPHGCDDEDCDDDHCEDGCCDGDEHAHEEEEDEEIPNWTLEVGLDSNGEPTPLTYALVKLLSLNKLELSKFLKTPEKINLQLLTTNSSKAYKILKELVELRSNQYDRDIKYQKYIKSKNYREQAAAQLVLHEQNIIKKALLNISKKV